MASGKMSGKETLEVGAARREVAGGKAVCVDVRSEEEFGRRHVPGAIHLPEADPSAGSREIEQGARLVVIGDNAKAAREAAGRLSEQGYEAVALDGKIDDWAKAGGNLQPTEDPDEDTELGAS